jgi:hypothetical protein
MTTLYEGYKPGEAMFRPMCRHKFHRAAYALKTKQMSTSGLGWYQIWSCAFKHESYPGLLCIALSGEDDDCEFYGNYLVDTLGESATVVSQHTAVSFITVTALSTDNKAVLECIKHHCGKSVMSSGRVSQRGFFDEQFYEWLPDEYIHVLQMGVELS